MKTKLALSLLVAALLPACTTVKSTARSADQGSRYSDSSTEATPPGEGVEADIPAEGPRDVNANPAYMPTPLLRAFAAGGP